MTDKTIIGGLTLVGSLSAYYYAKANGKDRYPLMLIAGFFGAFIGDQIVEHRKSLVKKRPKHKRITF